VAISAFGITQSGERGIYLASCRNSSRTSISNFPSMVLPNSFLAVPQKASMFDVSIKAASAVSMRDLPERVAFLSVKLQV
jgi:hypothetical protein